MEGRVLVFAVVVFLGVWASEVEAACPRKGALLGPCSPRRCSPRRCTAQGLECCPNRCGGSQCVPGVLGPSIGHNPSSCPVLEPPKEGCQPRQSSISCANVFCVGQCCHDPCGNPRCVPHPGGGV
ncbi:unnamed protein product [Ixodes pacificus]